MGKDSLFMATKNMNSTYASTMYATNALGSTQGQKIGMFS